MELPSDFWVETRGVFDGGPLTIESIRAAEFKFGVRFPPLLTQALLMQNGGRMRRTALPVESGRDQIGGAECIDFTHIVPLHRFERISIQPSPPQSEYEVIYFGSTGTTSDMVCFDYRECGPSGDPAIVLVAPVVNSDLCFRFGNTLADVLSRLIRGDRYDYYTLGDKGDSQLEVWNRIVDRLALTDTSSRDWPERVTTFYGTDRTWRSARAPKTPASFTFQRNIDILDALAFSSEPSSNWLLRVDILPRLRGELLHDLRAIDSAWKPIHLVDWSILWPEVLEL